MNDRETEVERIAAIIAEDGSQYRYPAVVGVIRSIVRSDQSPFAKLRDIEIALEALDSIERSK